MKEDIKHQWLEALRSGKYEQGRQSLCVSSRYCCLGVLAEITGHLSPLDEVGYKECRVINKEDGTYEDSELTSDLLQTFGLSSDQQCHLIVLNDGQLGCHCNQEDKCNKCRPRSFLEIADWIEENL